MKPDHFMFVTKKLLSTHYYPRKYRAARKIQRWWYIYRPIPAYNEHDNRLQCYRDGCVMTDRLYIRWFDVPLEFWGWIQILRPDGLFAPRATYSVDYVWYNPYRPVYTRHHYTTIKIFKTEYEAPDLLRRMTSIIDTVRGYRRLALWIHRI